MEDDIDAILSNPVVSVITKWRTFRLLKWVQYLHQSVREHGIFMLIDLQMTVFVGKKVRTWQPVES
jgi:hypothetical protein